MRVNTGKRKRYLKKFTHRMQLALMFVFCIIVLGFFILLGRLYQLNHEDNERYKKRVLSQQTYMSHVIPYKRGEIRDRNSTTMAISVHVYDLVIDPSAILEKQEYTEETLQALIDNFDVTREELLQILKEKPKFKYVKINNCKDLSTEAVEPFKEIKHNNKNIKGVWLEEKYQRKYPKGAVASHVIGFSDGENVGAWGIEETYNDILNGISGREYGYFDSELNLERTVKSSMNGSIVVSTIDANVQAIVEKKIDEWQGQIGSVNMAVILADPSTGEIYAMSNYPVYDLNHPRDLTAFFSKAEIKNLSEKEQLDKLNKIWRNYCISDTYEPGSTYKPFTIAAALEESKVSPASTFVCDGVEVVSGVPMHCANNIVHNTLNLSGTLEKSCNDSLIHIGKILGRKRFFHYHKLFGFWEKTDIDLPGEAIGINHSEEQLNPVELATSSYGQTQNVTMIEMMAGFNSLINGGSYYKPHVVKQILNEQGAVIENIEPTIVKQSVSKSTSDFIRQSLYDTVEKGTADGAKVAGYEIGGKTGTAQKGPRDDKNYIVSFLGFTPLKSPKVSIYVVIDQPNVNDQSHSSIATEFASDLLKEVLPFLEVYPNREVTTKKEENGTHGEPSDTDNED